MKNVPYLSQMNAAVLSHLSSAHRPLDVMYPQPADSGKAPVIKKFKLGAFI